MCKDRIFSYLCVSSNVLYWSNMKNLRIIFFALAAVIVLHLNGCSNIQGIKVTACSIESITPIGLRGVRAELAIVVENPALQFALSDIKGFVYYKGKLFVEYLAEPILVKRHTVAVYPLKGEVRLAPDVSLGTLLSLARGYDLADFSVDIQARIGLKSGLSKLFTFKDIPVKDLVGE